MGAARRLWSLGVGATFPGIFAGGVRGCSLFLPGDRGAADALTPTLDHIVIDRGAQVAEDARAIRVLRQRVPVVAFVNNHFPGYAPETARQLVALTAQAGSA